MHAKLIKKTRLPTELRIFIITWLTHNCFVLIIINQHKEYGIDAA